MTHTPGPWKREGTLVYALTEYLGERRYNAGKLRFPDGVNRFSCSLQGGGKEAAPPEEMEANARLIQAAPELLERLKVMCREWREIVGTPENNSTPGDCLERAEAAIAKAEGNG